jgi:hypothetical protein
VQLVPEFENAAIHIQEVVFQIFTKPGQIFQLALALLDSVFDGEHGSSPSGIIGTKGIPLLGGYGDP